MPLEPDQPSSANQTNEASSHFNAAMETPDTSGGAQIEVDDGSVADDESEDGYGTDSLNSEFTSITSSIRNHEFENGRRYHRFHAGKYVMPNDDSEQDREDLKHEMVLRLMERRLHLAPIGENPQNIIELVPIFSGGIA